MQIKTLVQKKPSYIGLKTQELHLNYYQQIVNC